MNSIELMVNEHKNIIRMLAVVKNASNRIVEGEQICYDDFEKMIDFIRKYADVHHHGKEEKFLSKEMVDNLGAMGTSLVTHGMLVEHDWGRLFVSELSAALERVKSGDKGSRIDVIANAVGYANHLTRHIGKEDEVVYKFAEKKLEPEILDCINQQTEAFEEEATMKGVQKYYLECLEQLERKYLVVI